MPTTNSNGRKRSSRVPGTNQIVYAVFQIADRYDGHKTRRASIPMSQWVQICQEHSDDDDMYASDIVPGIAIHRAILIDTVMREKPEDAKKLAAVGTAFGVLEEEVVAGFGITKEAANAAFMAMLEEESGGDPDNDW